MPIKEFEKLDLDTISPISNSQIDDKIKTISKERRLTIYHYVVHILAFIIVIPFIGMILFGIEIPETYSTIVSVVIGFYFARTLFN